MRLPPSPRWGSPAVLVETSVEPSDTGGTSHNLHFHSGAASDKGADDRAGIDEASQSVWTSQHHVRHALAVRESAQALGHIVRSDPDDSRTEYLRPGDVVGQDWGVGRLVAVLCVNDVRGQLGSVEAIRQRCRTRYPPFTRRLTGGSLLRCRDGRRVLSS